MNQQRTQSWGGALCWVVVDAGIWVLLIQHWVLAGIHTSQVEAAALLQPGPMHHVAAHADPASCFVPCTCSPSRCRLGPISLLACMTIRIGHISVRQARLAPSCCWLLCVVVCLLPGGDANLGLLCCTADRPWGGPTCLAPIP